MLKRKRHFSSFITHDKWSKTALSLALDFSAQKQYHETTPASVTASVSGDLAIFANIVFARLFFSKQHF